MDINEDKAENTPAGGVLMGKKDGQTIMHDKGTMSGYLVGKLHKDGGIKAVNKATGQPLEMQGGEVVITAPAVSDQTKREFEGKMMTNREILSAINEKGGGVSFANGGDIPAKIHTNDCEYKLGGKVVKDTDIAQSLGMKSTLKKGKQHFTSGDTTYDVDAIYNAIKKGKLRLKTKEVETFPMKYPVYDKKYSETVKTDFRKPNGITVLTESGEEVLIDGNHRMNNAYLKGRKTMKTYYIEDTKQIASFTKKNKFELGGENKVAGHLSSGKSLKQIAEMHNVSLAHINEQLAKGLEVEKEHFADFKERTRVAKDHLVENPNYYTILEKAGLKDGGHLIHHRHSNNLVKDAKSGNTPARDLNNYNDIMDLEADGMVGMESGLAYAKGGLVTKSNLKNIEKGFLELTDNSNYKGIYDEDEIDNGVALEWGKYGYSVSEDQQDEDYKMLRDATAKFNTKNIGKLYASAELGDKYNTVTIFDYDMLANDSELVSRLPEKYFAKLKVGRSNNRNVTERIKQEADKLKELEAVGVISKKLGVSQEKAENILFSLKYDKEYYEKNKNQTKPRFDVFSSRNFPRKDFENLEQTLDYIQSDAFANSVYMSTGYGNPISEGTVHLYGWGALSIKYKQDDFPFKPDGSTDFYKDRTTTLKIHPYLAVNVSGKQDFMTSFKKGISDFVWCYNYYVLGANDKKNLDDIDNLSDLLKFVETGSYAKGGEVKDIEPYFESFSINGLSGVDYAIKSQVNFDNLINTLDNAKRGIENKYVGYDKFPFHDFVKKYDYFTKKDFRYSNQDHKAEIDSLVEKLKKDGYTVLTKTYSFTKGASDGFNINNRAINVFAFKLKSFANGGITPYDANSVGDSVPVLEDEFAKGGVVYDTTKPKIEKVTIVSTGASISNRPSVIGRTASTVSELQQIVSDYIGTSPQQSYDYVAFNINDIKSGKYYIELNKGKKNTVKNVNPETLNSMNFKRVIDNKASLVKNYDWTDFFEGASNKTVRKGKTVDRVNVIYFDTNGKDRIIQEVGNPIQLYNFLKKLHNDGKRYAEIQPSGNGIVEYPKSVNISTSVWQDILFVKPEKEAIESIMNTVAFSLFPKSDFSKFNNRYTTITNASNSAKPFDLTNTKIWLDEDQALSETVQNLAFQLGWAWGGTDKVIKYLSADSIYFGDTNVMSYGDTGKEFFNNEPNKEITIDDLLGTQASNSALKVLTKDLYNSKIWIGNNVELRDKAFEKLVDLGFVMDRKYNGDSNVVITIDDYNFYVSEVLREDFEKNKLLKEIFPSDLGIQMTTASLSAQPFDFTDTKINVEDNPDLSLQVQRKAFEEGWEWESGGGKTLDYDDFNYLYFTKTSISFGNTASSFNNSPKREITYREIFGSQNTNLTPISNNDKIDEFTVSAKSGGSGFEDDEVQNINELYLALDKRKSWNSTILLKYKDVKGKNKDFGLYFRNDPSNYYELNKNGFTIDYLEAKLKEWFPNFISEDFFKTSTSAYKTDEEVQSVLIKYGNGSEYTALNEESLLSMLKDIWDSNGKTLRTVQIQPQGRISSLSVFKIVDLMEKPTNDSYEINPDKITLDELRDKLSKDKNWYDDLDWSDFFKNQNQTNASSTDNVVKKLVVSVTEKKSGNNEKVEIFSTFELYELLNKKWKKGKYDAIVYPTGNFILNEVLHININTKFWENILLDLPEEFGIEAINKELEKKFSNLNFDIIFKKDTEEVYKVTLNYDTGTQRTLVCNNGSELFSAYRIIEDEAEGGSLEVVSILSLKDKYGSTSHDTNPAQEVGQGGFMPSQIYSYEDFEKTVKGWFPEYDLLNFFSGVNVGSGSVSNKTIVEKLYIASGQGFSDIEEVRSYLDNEAYVSGVKEVVFRINSVFSDEKVIVNLKDKKSPLYYKVDTRSNDVKYAKLQEILEAQKIFTKYDWEKFFNLTTKSQSTTNAKPMVESVLFSWKESGLNFEEKTVKTPEELFNLVKEAYHLNLESVNIQPLGNSFVTGTSILSSRLKDIVLSKTFEEAEAEFMSELQFGIFPELDFSEFIRNSTSQAPATNTSTSANKLLTYEEAQKSKIWIGKDENLKSLVVEKLNNLGFDIDTEYKGNDEKAIFTFVHYFAIGTFNKEDFDKDPAKEIFPSDLGIYMSTPQSTTNAKPIVEKLYTANGDVFSDIQEVRDYIVNRTGFMEKVLFNVNSVNSQDVFRVELKDQLSDTYFNKNMGVKLMTDRLQDIFEENPAFKNYDWEKFFTFSSNANTAVNKGSNLAPYEASQVTLNWENELGRNQKATFYNDGIVGSGQVFISFLKFFI